MRRVVVVPTGTANLASVEAALRRAGRDPVRASEAREIIDAEHVVLPGVGTFGAAMEELAARGFVAHLAERFRSGRKTLAICLGMQLLADASDESPGVPGFGLVPATIRRLPAGVRIPEMGWNRVSPVASEGEATWLEPGDAYFAHSYALLDDPGPAWQRATTTHGVPFVSAIARDGLLACQFHPELSGAWGAELIARWLG